MATKASVIGCAMLVLLALMACAGNQLSAASAGETGCSPAEITIANDDHGGFTRGVRTWSAECRGEVYYCTATGSTISCSQPAESRDDDVALADESAPGCTKDTDCKGTRVCRDATCVDP